MGYEREQEIRLYLASAIALDSNSNARYMVQDLCEEIDRLRDIIFTIEFNINKEKII